ncbi:MAG TPA: UV DNA damage repair endonuclease UvsE [Candidatus Onthousia excrementipullorum]|uniref:UV DNA damage repair endonuclease UvsE n=1 Tax=Candidatus Onthousia excrementipullorum TaxID=2840884 RepID=A0A9D1DU24_9FIRM|nr:UV DNA damage repair endonuclease UvsE [Candidatus Onthousia excrementipullorum]
MQINLGYVGNPPTLLDIYSHNLTFKEFSKYDNDKGIVLLTKRIKLNFKNFEKVLKYNYDNKIKFYRMTHTMFPLLTHPNVNIDYKEVFKNEFNKLKKTIDKYNIRIDTHPDEFCLLTSEKENVTLNSIEILKFHLEIFKLLGINGKCVLHLGSSKPTKEEALNRFRDNFNKLPIELKKLIILENDDKTYTVTDTLLICEELNIPMVLDYHHFSCNHLKNERIDKLLPRIIKTWENTNLNPKMHFSCPLNSKQKRNHSTYLNYNSFIRFLKLLKPLNTDIDIMLEAKGKDEALFRLVRQLKFYKDFKVKGTTIIL